jgi:hypothetical protein
MFIYEIKKCIGGHDEHNYITENLQDALKQAEIPDDWTEILFWENGKKVFNSDQYCNDDGYKYEYNELLKFVGCDISKENVNEGYFKIKMKGKEINDK